MADSCRSPIEHIIGAGLVAGDLMGVPKLPATSSAHRPRNFNRALEGCMSDKLSSQGVPDVRALADQAEDLAEDSSIDPLTGLGKDRVYVFSGGKGDFLSYGCRGRGCATFL